MTSISEDLGRGRQERQAQESVERLLGDEYIDMDQEARDLANQATSKIESHEQVCAERWRGANQAQTRVENTLANIQKAMDDRIGRIPAAIITVMGTVIGAFASHTFFH